MAPQSEQDELTAAWRALDQRAGGRGWQVISLESAKHFSVMAGRKSPGNEESILVGISGITIGKDFELPRGRGFVVMRTEVQGDHSGLEWLALVRQQGGPLPLFTLMAADLVALLRGASAEPSGRIYNRFVERLKAWQRFMSRDRPQVLAAEEEVGLIGELIVLGNLIADGMVESDAIEAWEGPDDGLRDFVIGTGGIESKTTVAPTGFIARIGNLDQLDNSLYQPLYIGAVRLGQSEAGKTLPQIADELMQLFSASGDAGTFEGRLTAAGYLPTLREHYTRKFVLSDLSYRLVTDACPRLIRSSVPSGILEAQYSLDLNAYPSMTSTFRGISGSFGIKT